MNVQSIGPRRPRLGLPFGRTRATPEERNAPTLPREELRRIVAEILG